jgi:hypothetical protein
MANAKSKRRSRKPRGPAQTPRAVTSQRREVRAQQLAAQRRQSASSSRSLGTFGPPPQGLFGALPVAEIAILAGLIGIVVGIINGGGTALNVGVIACALGVLEVTVREHFSGYRSHSTLLAAAPAVGVELLLAELVGVPTQRVLLLLPVIPVFGLGFWIFRRAFQTARQTRVARSSSP